MPRPFKYRRVNYMPEVTYFKPAGIPMRALEEVLLSIEELEAIRLKDIEELEQEQAAGKMNVSRPTFQRVLASARKKIADALINGKSMNIKGGNFEVASRRFRCRHGHEWNLRQPSTAMPELCPTCSTTEVQPVLLIGTGNSRRDVKRHGI